MAKQGCRDCSRCTVSAANSCFYAIPRALWELLIYFPYRMWQKKCPVCHHPLAWHSKDAAGRFKD